MFYLLVADCIWEVVWSSGPILQSLSENPRLAGFPDRGYWHRQGTLAFVKKILTCCDNWKDRGQEVLDLHESSCITHCKSPLFEKGSIFSNICLLHTNHSKHIFCLRKRGWPQGTPCTKLIWITSWRKRLISNQVVKIWWLEEWTLKQARYKKRPPGFFQDVDFFFGEENLHPFAKWCHGHFVSFFFVGWGGWIFLLEILPPVVSVSMSDAIPLQVVRSSWVMCSHPSARLKVYRLMRCGCRAVCKGPCRRFSSRRFTCINWVWPPSR